MPRLTRSLLQPLSVIAERLIFLVPQLATIVLISRYWGEARLGEYVLVMAWARTFQAASSFGITECLAREVGRTPARASTYVFHSLALVAGLSIVAALCMDSVAWAIDYPEHVTRAILLGSSTLLPAAVLATCRGTLVARGRLHYMAGIGVVESAILLALNVYWVLNDAALTTLIATVAGASFVSATLALALVHLRVAALRSRIRPLILRRLWRRLLPFGLSSLIIFPSIRFDILLLSRMVPFSALGLYSAASKIMELTFTLTMAFYLPMLPRAARDMHRGEANADRGLRAPLSWYFAVMTPLAFGIFAFAEPILRLLFGPSFAPAAPILQMLMAASLVFAIDVALMMVCRAAGFQRTDLKFVAVSSVTNVAACVVLIAAFGSIGAGAAILASHLLGALLRWNLVSRLVPGLSWVRILWAPALTSGILAGGVIAIAGQAHWLPLALGYAGLYAAIALSSFPVISTAARQFFRSGLSYR